MSTTANIAYFNQKQLQNKFFSQKSIQDIYAAFLESLTPNTRTQYHQNIDQFFNAVFGDTLDSGDITTQQLGMVDGFTVQEYINALRQGEVFNKQTGACYEKSSANTIAAKKGALGSLWKYMSAFIPDMNPNAWNVKVKTVRNPYDTLTENEVKLLIEWSKTQGYKGEIAALCFELAYATAIRKTAIATLKWEDIKKQFNTRIDGYIWTIAVLDKGDKRTNIPISDAMYAKLRSVSDHPYNVFDISSGTLERIFAKFVDHFELSKESRRLCIHSIKSASIDMAYDKTGGDLKRASEHGQHADSVTTERHYIRKNIDPLTKVSYQYVPSTT